MTPLSDALTVAQRSALAALEKAYVAEMIEAEAFTESLENCGITDPVDLAFLVASLGVLREWGVSAPTMTERVAAENEPASDKQLAFIRKLADEKALPGDDRPNKPLTKTEASELIGQLQAGVYDRERWVVPFCRRCLSALRVRPDRERPRARRERRPGSH